MSILLAASLCVCVCVCARAADTFTAVPLRPGPPVRVVHVLSAAPPATAAPSQRRPVEPSDASTSYFYYIERPTAPRPSLPAYDDTYDDPVRAKETSLSDVTVPQYRYRYPDEVYEVPARAPPAAVFRYPSDAPETEYSAEQEDEPLVAPRPPPRLRRPPAPARPSQRVYLTRPSGPPRPERHAPATTEMPVIIRIHKYRVVKTNH